MDILNQIITGFTKEDTRFFKLFSSRMNISKERKDIALLDYIRKAGNLYDDEKIFKKLYTIKDKNSYYALRNRLMHDVCRSLSAQHCFKDGVRYIHHLLLLVRLFFTRRQFKVSLFFLKKAEAEAKKIENHDLLDVVYSEFIKLSHELLHVNPEEYIRKRNENQQMLNNIRQIDDILAAVYYRLKTSQNFSEKENPIHELLRQTADTFSKDPIIKASPKLKFKICGAVIQILLQRHEYEALEKYLLKTYKEFVKARLFHNENHNAKLEILNYIVNVLFKNKKYKESLEYAGIFYKAIQEHSKLHYDNFLFFYYNSLVINYSVLNKEKAISILEELLAKNTLKNTPFYEIFVYLNLAVLWFEKSDYRAAIRNLNKLYLHDEFKNADPALTFKIAVSELIIRYDLLDFDFLEVRIRQIKKQFITLLKKPEHQREKEILYLLQNIMTSPRLRANKKLMGRIQSFLQSQDHRIDDTEIIKYNDWLNSKIRQ